MPKRKLIPGTASLISHEGIFHLIQCSKMIERLQTSNQKRKREDRPEDASGVPSKRRTSVALCARMADNGSWAGTAMNAENFDCGKDISMLMSLYILHQGVQSRCLGVGADTRDSEGDRSVVLDIGISD